MFGIRRKYAFGPQSVTSPLARALRTGDRRAHDKQAIPPPSGERRAAMRHEKA